MMLGYYNNPEATAKAWQNDWFCTGDRGYLDQDGFFYFVDRAKESIKRRGENVSSFEVESVLMKYPGIKDAAVVPYKNVSVGDEEVRAFLVLHPNAEKTFDIAALAEYCGKHMAYFMVPRYFDIESELPRNAIEKIEKYKLRDRPLSARTVDTKTLDVAVQR
jgi:crotonobetaine/carnitine-CoA ligase